MPAHIFQQRITTQTTVTISPPAGESALWDTINGTGASTYSTPMGANTWREHKTAINQNTTDGMADIGGYVPPTLAVYVHKMSWNPIDRTMEFFGGGHPQTAPAKLSWARYFENVNSYGSGDRFKKITNSAAESGTHGYDHCAVNPHNGDVYYRQYGTPYYQGGIGVYKKPAASSTFTLMSPRGPVVNFGVASGTCWWSGAFTPAGFPAAGAHGCLMIFGNETQAADGGPTNGRILGYDPIADSWFYNQTGRAPGGGGNPGQDQNYHQIMTYNPVKNYVVYGGGNYDYGEFWKMTATGAVTTMPKTDTLSGVANKGASGGQNTGKLVFDPASGHFIMVSRGEVWMLNADGAGVWTSKGSSPAAVYGEVPGSQHVVAVPLPDHGVIAFISQTSSTGGTFWLYKSQ